MISSSLFILGIQPMPHRIKFAHMLRAIQKNCGYHFSVNENITNNGKNSIIGIAIKIQNHIWYKTLPIFLSNDIIKSKVTFLIGSTICFTFA